MPQANDQLQPVDPLQQALLMAQMGQPTAPSHDPGQVQAALLQALMSQRQADDIGIRPQRQEGEYGWGSALTELARPFVAKRSMKNANEELASALGKKGDLERHDAALAEYKAGIAAAQKQIDEATMYDRKKQIDKQYAPPEEPSDYERYKSDPTGYAAFKSAGQKPEEPSDYERYMSDPEGYEAFKSVGKNGADPNDPWGSDFKGRVGARNDLRRYYQPEVTKFRSVQSDYKKLTSALDANSGAGDVAAIYSLIKGLDPGSAVREGEVGLMNAANSVIGRLGLKAESMFENKALSESMKTEIQTLMGELTRITGESFGSVFEEAKQRAEADGLDPSEVFSEELESLVTTQTKAPKETKEINGKTYIKVDGKWYEG